MREYVIALYIRLSVEDYKYDSLSIESQRRLLNEVAASLPEADGAEITEYVDNGYSGANFERPQIQALLNRVRANEIDCIIVKDFSRFGRNSIEAGYFIEHVFPLYRTRFISVGDDYDSDHLHGDTGGIDVALKHLINETYSRDLSVKTKTAKYAKMQRGEYQSVICPYGYRKGGDGRMEPDPDSASVVKEIFRLASSGVTVSEILRKLYENGVPTPGEYKAAKGQMFHDASRTHGVWSRSTVLRILEDERYAGTYIMGKRKVTEVGGHCSRMKDRDKWFSIPDFHTPIVDRDTFQKVQNAITRYKLPNRKQHDYPLRGKVFCGICGHAMTRSVNKNGYYSCPHSQAVDDLPCHGLKVPIDNLENAVFDTLKAQMEAVIGGAENISDAVNALSVQVDKFGEQAAMLLDGKRELYERYITGEIDLEVYKIKKTGLDARLTQLQNSRALLKAQLKREQEQAALTAARHTARATLTAADHLTASLDDLLIEKILVFPANIIEIKYKPQLYLTGNNLIDSDMIRLLEKVES